jgi:transposase InsO family protein
MSLAAKVELMKSVQAEFGLAPALAVLGLPRSTWYYRAAHPHAYEERHAALRRPLEQIACEHPEYGYRRTTTELSERLGEAVNQKVVRRLHRCWGLPLMRQTRPPRPSGLRQVITAAGNRVNLLAQLEEVGPLTALHTDFTELVYAGGKAQLMALVDHTSKVVPGWALALHADTALALRAWTAVKRWLQRHGWPVAGIIVHHDQDSVYTGYGWTGQLVLRDRVQLSYALDGCHDNTEMESFHSRFKNENRSLLVDAADLADLARVVGQRITYYNHRRRHSALGNQAPLVYLASLKSRR